MSNIKVTVECTDCGKILQQVEFTDEHMEDLPPQFVDLENPEDHNCK